MEVKNLPKYTESVFTKSRTICDECLLSRALKSNFNPVMDENQQVLKGLFNEPVSRESMQGM